MRSSELQKSIDKIPELKLAQLKYMKLTGKVAECRDGKLWRFHNVKNGIDHWKVYNKLGKVYKKGVSK